MATAPRGVLRRSPYFHLARRTLPSVGSMVIWLLAGGPRAAAKELPIVVHRPTIVAFFPPVTQSELRDQETNEALSDFQFYAERVRDPLRKAGIEFQVVYGHSFSVRLGKTITTFRPGKADVGYYFIGPGRKPRVEYGVVTDVDLLKLAEQYFETDRPRSAP